MVLDLYSKIVLTLIAIGLALVVIIQLQPGPVVAQETAGMPVTDGSYQVTSPERDYAWVVTPGGYVWFCQSTFRGSSSGCERIALLSP